MLLFFVAGGAVLTALVLAILIWRARKVTALPGQAWAGMGSMRGMLAAAWRAVAGPLRYLSTPREARYRTAWILLLGQQAAGKSSLLSSFQPDGWLPPTAEQKKLVIPGSDWRFLPQGILIDPPGAWSGAAAGSKDGQAWQRFLVQLDSLRPERPIDGVILVISARSLQADSASARTALAELLRAQLATVTRRYELALPVYVVISEMDAVDGYSAFWRLQQAVAPHHMVGWSMPGTVPSEPPENWVDTAFDEMAGQLQRLQLQAAAQSQHLDPDQADRFFLFPRHFQQLRAPLRLCLAQVLQASAWQAGGFCRGVYFTGALPAAVPALAGLPAAAGGPRSDIGFVDDLIARKIFAEPYLARPTRQSIWSRNNLIRRAQFASVALAAVLLAGLAWSTLQLHRQVGVMRHGMAALQSMEQQLADQPVLPGQCIDRDSVFRALQQIAAFPVDTSYWAIPASWLAQRASGDSTRLIANGVLRKVVLAGIACQLQQQAQALMAPAAPAAPDNAGLVHAQALKSLLDQSERIVRFQQNLARFQAIANTPAALKSQHLLPSLLSLCKDVYQTTVPPSVALDQGALEAALQQVHDVPAIKLPESMRPRLATQLADAAHRLALHLQQEVADGNTMLAQLNQETGAVLPKARRFASWLQWMNGAWSGATASSNPCSAIAAQLGVHANRLRSDGYPDAELRRMTGYFDAASCYQPAMASLAAMQMAPFGALFARRATGMTLNRHLVSELAGLTSLVSLNFMQVQDTQPAGCQGKVAGWRASDIGLANRHVTEYQQFVSGMHLGATDSASQRPLYQRLALRQLERALNTSLGSAQVAPGATRVSFDPGASEDLALARESSDFAALLEPLLTLQRSYRSLGFAASAARLYQCIGSYSTDSLARIQNLGDISRLYEAAGSAGPGPMFDLGSTPVIKDFLARQLARTQVLAGYASAFLNYLNNSSGQNTAQSGTTQSAAYWSNTITELNRYTQFKEPAGQVAQLDNLFLKQMPGLDAGNCTEAMASAAQVDDGNDLFSAGRLKLVSQIQANCHGQRNAQASKSYKTLAQRFNQELAGRYPFGPLASRDANLLTTRNFFADYTAQSAPLRQSLSGLSGPYWSAARQFLAQLDTAAKFFQGTLNLAPAPTEGASDNAGLASLPIRLNVQFHAQANSSPGAEQLVGWSLSSGSKAAAFPNRATSLDWQYGQALVLDLTWASGSLWLPAPDLQQSDLQTNGVGASFAASGDWALLRLMEGHQPGNGAISNGNDPNRVLLEFLVPVASTATAPGKAASGIAKLYVGLNLGGSDPKTHAPVSLKLPSGWPRSAP